MLTHLLDTSAWITHLQNEADAPTVADILSESGNRVGISALSLVELHARLNTFSREEEPNTILDDYREIFAQIVPVDEAIALLATKLRSNSSRRVPAINALIAATAAHHNAVLVHRDPHFLALAGEAVRQQAL